MNTFSDGTPVPDEDYGGDDNWAGDPGYMPPGGTAADPGGTHPLYRVLNRIATALEKLAENPSRPPSNAPGAPQPPSAQGMPPNGPPPSAPSNGPDPVKAGKKIYAICREQGWDIPGVGASITGHPMGPNSQKWSSADQIAVLDQFKEWGHG